MSPILRISARVSCLWLAVTQLSPAIVDTNSNGLSDIWEISYNGEPFPGTFDPEADPDSDGWSNRREEAAGTNPFDANPPGGFIQPVLEYHQAVYLNGEDGPELVTPEIYTLEWATLIGKQYTLLFSADLSSGSWQPIGQPVIAIGNQAQAGIAIAQPDGSVPSALFWRVSVTDADSDGDSLTDHEEHKLGTNPFIDDSDDDGTLDAQDEDTYTNHLQIRNLASTPGTGSPDGGSTGGGTPGGGPSGVGGLAETEPLYLNFSRKDYAENWVKNPPLNEEDEATYNNNTSKKTYNLLGAIMDDTKSGETRLGTSHASLHGTLAGMGYPTFPAINTPELRNMAFNGADMGTPVYAQSSHYSSSTAGGGSASSTRFRLERPDPLPYARTLNYLKVRYTYDEFHSVSQNKKLAGIEPLNLTILPNQLHSDEVDLETDQDDSTVHLARFSVTDNLPATGVDNISNTVENTLGSGYQEYPWIMSPIGSTITVGGTAFPVGNDVVIGIRGASYPLNDLVKITCPEATASPEVFEAGSDKNAMNLTLKSNASATSDETPEFKFGSGADQFIATNLPLRVKVMKKRTVNVGVYPVSHLWFGHTVPVPTAAQLTYHLNQIYGSQVNAWMDVSIMPQVKIAFADADTRLHVANGGSTMENFIVSEIEARPEAAGFDIIVIIINGVDYGYAFQPTPSSPSAFNPVQGHRINEKSCIVSSGSLKSGNFSMVKVLGYISHEMAHIMTNNDGHPDVEEGVAPLLGSDRTRRTTCSGWNRADDAKFLAKAEWDEIELWLKAHPDVRIMNTTGNSGNY